VAKNSSTCRYKYMDSYISPDSNIDSKISTGIGLQETAEYLKACMKAVLTKTKIKIYSFNVCSVLMYASETWRTKRRLKAVFKEQHVTNVGVCIRTDINNITNEVKKRRLRWLGLRMKRNLKYILTLH
jgi:hypothetical protein